MAEPLSGAQLVDAQSDFSDFPVAFMGSFLNSYTADKYDGVMAQRLQGASYFRLGRDVRVLFIFLGAILNQPLLALGVVAVVMNVEVVRRIMICRRVPAV